MPIIEPDNQRYNGEGTKADADMVPELKQRYSLLDEATKQRVLNELTTWLMKEKLTLSYPAWHEANKQ